MVPVFQIFMQCAVAFGKFKFSEIAPTAQIIHLSSSHIVLRIHICPHSTAILCLRPVYCVVCLHVLQVLYVVPFVNGNDHVPLG